MMMMVNKPASNDRAVDRQLWHVLRSTRVGVNMFAQRLSPLPRAFTNPLVTTTVLFPLGIELLVKCTPICRFLINKLIDYR